MRNGLPKLLIVEDDPTFADVLIEVARRRGLDAQVAPRGDDGIAMARHVTPTVVVLDLTMPGMDGWVVLDRLRHDPATRHVPVCVVTGDERRERALRLGAFAFLQKPASLDALSTCLERAAALSTREVRNVALLGVAEPVRARLGEAFATEPVHIEACDSAKTLPELPYDVIVVGSPPPPSTVVDAVESLGAHRTTDRPILVLEHDGCPADRHLRDAGGEAFVHRVREDQLVAELASRAHLAGRRARRPDGRLRGRTVLLIDDDPRNLVATGALLEAEGMAVRAARGAEDALRLLHEEGAPDIVLTDIMMPGMDGYALMRAIRSVPHLSTTPILALTAKAMRGDRERCLQAGATDYVPKPLDPDQLLSTMRVALTT